MILVDDATGEPLGPGDKIKVNGIKCHIVKITDSEDPDDRCVTVGWGGRITYQERQLKVSSIKAHWLL